jgi:hypothetical protein
LFAVCGAEVHDSDIVADRLSGSDAWLELAG